MSAAAALALQKAVYDRLSADSVLTSRLGGTRIFDAVPRNAAAPYVRLSDMRSRDYATSTEAGCEIIFAVMIWSRQDGSLEGLSLAARIEELLHDRALTVAGFTLVNLRQISAEARRDDRLEGRRVRLRFRAVLQA